MIDVLKSMHDMFTKQHELAAIGINMKVVTDKGLTCVLRTNDMVRMEGDVIVDITHECPATHTITKCLGTPVGLFEIELIDGNGNFSRKKLYL